MHLTVTDKFIINHINVCRDTNNRISIPLCLSLDAVRQIVLFFPTDMEYKSNKISVWLTL